MFTLNVRAKTLLNFEQEFARLIFFPFFSSFVCWINFSFHFFFCLRSQFKLDLYLLRCSKSNKREHLGVKSCPNDRRDGVFFVLERILQIGNLWIYTREYVMQWLSRSYKVKAFSQRDQVVMFQRNHDQIFCTQNDLYLVLFHF